MNIYLDIEQDFSALFKDETFPAMVAQAIKEDYTDMDGSPYVICYRTRKRPDDLWVVYNGVLMVATNAKQQYYERQVVFKEVKMMEFST